MGKRDGFDVGREILAFVVGLEGPYLGFVVVVGLRFRELLKAELEVVFCSILSEPLGLT